jgi:hypothetical protein
MAAGSGQVFRDEIMEGYILKSAQEELAEDEAPLTVEELSLLGLMGKEFISVFVSSEALKGMPNPTAQLSEFLKTINAIKNKKRAETLRSEEFQDFLMVIIYLKRMKKSQPDIFAHAISELSKVPEVQFFSTAFARKIFLESLVQVSSVDMEAQQLALSRAEGSLAEKISDYTKKYAFLLAEIGEISVDFSERLKRRAEAQDKSFTAEATRFGDIRRQETIKAMRKTRILEDLQNSIWAHRVMGQEINKAEVAKWAVPIIEEFYRANEAAKAAEAMEKAAFAEAIKYTNAARDVVAASRHVDTYRMEAVRASEAYEAAKARRTALLSPTLLSELHRLKRIAITAAPRDFLMLIPAPRSIKDYPERMSKAAILEEKASYYLGKYSDGTLYREIKQGSLFVRCIFKPDGGFEAEVSFVREKRRKLLYTTNSLFAYPYDLPKEDPLVESIDPELLAYLATEPAATLRRQASINIHLLFTHALLRVISSEAYLIDCKYFIEAEARGDGDVEKFMNQLNTMYKYLEAESSGGIILGFFGLKALFGIIPTLSSKVAAHQLDEKVSADIAKFESATSSSGSCALVLAKEIRPASSATASAGAGAR